MDDLGEARQSYQRERPSPPGGRLSSAGWPEPGTRGFGVGCPFGERTRLRRPHALDDQTHPSQQEAELAGGVAPGPEVGRPHGAGRRSDLRGLVAQAAVGVERRFEVVLHGEIGVEGRQQETSGGGEGLPHTEQHLFVLVVGGHQSEGPLTQADHRIEPRHQVGALGKPTGVEPLEGDVRQVDGGRSRQRDEGVRDVDPVDHQTPASQLQTVPTRTATDVQDPLPGPKPQSLDDEVDLLNGSLCERVPEIGLAHVIGQFLEPVSREVVGLPIAPRLGGASIVVHDLSPFTIWRRPRSTPRRRSPRVARATRRRSP